MEKMPGDQFCLRWNNHQPNLISVFSSLLQNDQMVDVTLILDNREIHAHKIVLSACSPFFQNIFLRNACKHPVIVLAGIKYIHMKSLIEFIYNGEVNIYQDHLTELLRVANILKIKGLDEMPPSQMTEADEEPQPNNQFKNTGANTTLNISKDPSNLVPAIKIDTGDSTNAKDPNAPSTSDQTKSTKKRKSVSFSDTPEIVRDQSNDSDEVWPGSSGNGKRKLRSLSDVCSITKIKKEPQPNTPDDDDETDKTNLVVTINPHSLYSSNESIDTMNQSSTGTLIQQHRTSRKMIRKNENFLRALEAVRDEGIGFCKAAKIHGVNNRTLWLEYQKRGYPMKNARKKSQS